MSSRSVFVLVALVWFALLAGHAPAQSKSVGQTLERGALVDGDYLFELAPPGDDWNALDEREASRIHPNAIAGLRNEAGLTGCVLVYRVRKQKLADLHNWLVEWAPIDDRTTLSRGAGLVSDQPTFAVIGFGDLDKARVRFQIQAFLHKGFLYLLLAYGPFADVSAQATELQPFFDAFRLRKGTPTARAVTEVREDEFSAGWSLQDGVFLQPLYGLELDVPQGWQVITPSRTGLLSDRVLFVSRDPQALVVVTSEVLDASLEQAWLASAAETSSFQVDWRVPAGLKPAKLALAGVELNAEWNGGRIDPLHHYLRARGVGRSLGYRIDMQTLQGEEARALDALRKLLAAARPLANDERAELALAAHARDSASESLVGPTGCLRDGRYTDYAGQFSLATPRGFFEPYVVGDEKLEESELRLVMLDPARDLNGMLISFEQSGGKLTLQTAGKRESFGKATPRRSCEQVLEWLCGPEPEGEATPQRSNNALEDPIAAGPWAMFALSAEYESRGMPYRAWAAALERNKRMVLCAWHGPKPAMLAAEPTLRASLESFRWSIDKSLPRHISKGRFVDEQLGVSFDLAGEDWKLEERRDRRGSEAYACELAGPQARLCLFELRASLAQPSAAAFAKQLQRRFGRDFGGIDWSKPSEFDARFGEHPARVWRFDGPNGRIEVDVVLAHGLVYGLAFARQGASEAGPDEFLALKKRIAFGTDPLPAATDAPKPGTDEPTEPPEPAPGTDDAPSEEESAPLEARAEPARENLPAVGVLELGGDWRAIPLHDTYAGLDLAAALRARPHWLADLVQGAQLAARGPGALPQLGFARVTSASARWPDTLVVERFAPGSATDSAEIAQAIEACARAASATASTRVLDAGRLGPIHVVEWHEPEAPAAKSKPAKNTPAGSTAPARHVAVYVLLDRKARGWAIVIRRVAAPTAEETAQLERAIRRYEPLP